MKPVACSCETCRAMCRTAACIPTPDEARALVRRFPQRMAIYQDLPAGVAYVAPAMDGGRCSFHVDGLCELHDDGKPLQGRLAHHDRPAKPLRAEMLAMWRGDVSDLIA